MAKPSDMLIVDSFANNEAAVATQIKLQLLDGDVEVSARCIYPSNPNPNPKLP